MIKVFAVLVVFSLFFWHPLSAETIILKSGKKISAKILEANQEYIKIDFAGSPLYYQLQYIESIEGENFSSVDPSFYLKKGLKYAAQGKIKEAEQVFIEGLKRKPFDNNLAEALNFVAYLKNGAIKEDYALNLFKGLNYLINKKYAQAAFSFKQALEIKPGDAEIYYYLGVTSFFLQQYPEAITYLVEAKKTKYDNQLYYYLGASSYSWGQYAQALEYLKKALQLKPDDADALFVVGMSNYSLGKTQEAYENLNKARELFQGKGDYLKANEIKEFIDQLG